MFFKDFMNMPFHKKKYYLAIMIPKFKTKEERDIAYEEKKQRDLENERLLYETQLRIIRSNINMLEYERRVATGDVIVEPLPRLQMRHNG
jgi:hypothetical protein